MKQIKMWYWAVLCDTQVSLPDSFSAWESWIMSQAIWTDFSRIMHEITSQRHPAKSRHIRLSSSKALPPWFGSILHCHPPLINPWSPAADGMSDCRSTGWRAQPGAEGRADRGRGGGARSSGKRVKVEEWGSPFLPLSLAPMSSPDSQSSHSF